MNIQDKRTLITYHENDLYTPYLGKWGFDGYHYGYIIISREMKILYFYSDLDYGVGYIDVTDQFNIVL